MSGRVLGDYEIVKQIGQGALGTVFLAEHRYTKKSFMLKVLPEELTADRQFIQRFESEVAALAGLEHPNIVKIHNVSSAQGLYFLVSDCVVDDRGETTNLAQFLIGRGGVLSEEETFSLLDQVAQALDYAHTKLRNDQPLFHGGLKPNNILIVSTKPSLTVQLCDFGLTPIVGESAVLTRTYRIVSETLGIVDQVWPPQEQYSVPSVDGTKAHPLHQSFLQSFAFLAPEQRSLSRRGECGIAVDSYSMGVLAYSLLMGRVPEGFFPFPSDHSEGMRHNWDAFLAGCLASDPKKRPTDLKAEIDAVAVSTGMASTANREAVTLLDKLRQTKGSEQTLQTVAPQKAPQAAVDIAQQRMTSAQPVLRSSQIRRPIVDHDPASALEVDPIVKQYVPEESSSEEVEPIPVDMVVIEGGSFTRGSRDGNRDEMPQHEVNVESFAIDVHPVTNEQYVRFLEVMGGEKDHRNQDLIKLKESRIKRGAGKLSIESGYGKHPVTGVTWYGAVSYAEWVGKRLPTEAEWEIAAGGGEGRRYPNGEEAEKSNANFFSSDTTKVMSYAANGLGLYDMAGNVYEWCSDWYGYNYYEASAQEPDNPKGPIQGVYRVLRGGCWKSLKEDLRCSRRHRNKPGTTHSTYGFRCAAAVN